MKRSINQSFPAADELERQAWAWLRRINSGDVRERDAEAFRRWLHSSPAHHSAFSAARQHWTQIKHAAGGVLCGNAQAAALHQQALRGPNLGRRAFLGAAASAAALGGVALLYPQLERFSSPAEWGADFRTATGEQRVVALAERVEVTLNTQTRIRRQSTGDTRSGIAAIDLLEGEAAIDLNAGGKPFSVLAGVGRSVAESGRFEVRHLDGKVCVSCIEGAVRIEHPAGSRLLGANQQLVYDRHALGGAAGIEATTVSAWRRGELVFRQTPLGRALGEIDRYRPGRIVLLNAKVRDQPVSGSFDVALLDLALAQLERTFALSAHALPGGLYLLS